MIRRRTRKSSLDHWQRLPVDLTEERKHLKAVDLVDQQRLEDEVALSLERLHELPALELHVLRVQLSLVDLLVVLVLHPLPVHVHQQLSVVLVEALVAVTPVEESYLEPAAAVAELFVAAVVAVAVVVYLPPLAAAAASAAVAVASYSRRAVVKVEKEEKEKKEEKREN